MQSFERLKRLIRTSIADLTAAAADPELALADVAEKIELGRGELCAAIEEAEGRRRSLSDRLAELQRSEAECTTEAEKAVAGGGDERAREVLRQRQQVRIDARALEARLTETELSLSSLRQDKADLERKLKTVRIEQTQLAARLRRAETERAAAELIRGLPRSKRAVEQLKEKVNALQDSGRADRRREPLASESSFSEFEEELILEAELEELKRRRLNPLG